MINVDIERIREFGHLLYNFGLLSGDGYEFYCDINVYWEHNDKS